MAGASIFTAVIVILLIISPIGIWNRLIKIHQTERQILGVLNELKKAAQRQNAILSNMTVAEE